MGRDVPLVSVGRCPGRVPSRLWVHLSLPAGIPAERAVRVPGLTSEGRPGNPERFCSR